jgi:hypothetical protein
MIILIVLAFNGAADALGRRLDPRNVVKQVRSRQAAM